MVGFEFEDRAIGDGFRRIAGLDEVGRGCLAGPVVAAAVILDRLKPLPMGLNDSKKLSKEKRETISAAIKKTALAWAIGQVEADKIDEINILQATKLAMKLAIDKLSISPEIILIDALELTDVKLPQKAIIKGDTISASIAAASVIAKVYRDDIMNSYDDEFPGYGFASNVGYGTRQHFEALGRLGATNIHRKSFKGVLPDLFGQ